mmetsp:Transcript_7054/g.16171  ORF Transcript_7054/g.16171 Transcript_7054/m.16171 type:complete len:123 (+) Transcript_7054:1107-1475(+)
MHCEHKEVIRPLGRRRLSSPPPVSFGVSGRTADGKKFIQTCLHGPQWVMRLLVLVDELSVVQENPPPPRARKHLGKLFFPSLLLVLRERRSVWEVTDGLPRGSPAILWHVTRPVRKATGEAP